MPNVLHGGVWRHTRTLFNEGVIGDLTDEQLLERFVTAHGEASEMAFEALLERHGPMVLRVCRAILRDRHDAEDAFQATFLVLARRAVSIRSRTSLASWLHGVARRVASGARSAACRRREHERRAAQLAEHFAAEPRWDDLAQVVHQEIDRLPEAYRAPVMLCDMEGLTEGQAARRLGRPVGTIRSQLSRGRERLRIQLMRRGLSPAPLVSVAARVGCSEGSVIAPSLVSSTIQSARHFALVRTGTAGTVSASAVALAEGFLGSMLMARISNIAMMALLALGAAGVVAFGLEPAGQELRAAGDVEREIRELMSAWAKAIVQSDVGTMDRILAYELIGTDPTGSLWDKAKYLEHVKTNAFHLDSVEFRDTKIQVYGDAAVEAGVAVAKVNANRPPYVAERGFIVERITRTWIKRQGSWQCVAFQTMVIEFGEQEADGQNPASNPGPNSGKQGVSVLIPSLPQSAPRP